MALTALCGHGWALAQPVVDLAPQLELAATALPSMQQPDAHMDTRASLTGWSGPAQQSGMGVGVGFTVPGPEMPGDPHPTKAGLDLGLHWRSADQGMGRVRVGLWQHLSPLPYPVGIASQTNPAANYNTRLEMQFSAASARGIQLELGGALGLQLNTNEKVVLRISRGKPMVYYRLQF